MAKKTYSLSYAFFETKDQAKRFAKKYNEPMLTLYMRKRHPATVQQWFSLEGGENKWIVWYPVG